MEGKGRAIMSEHARGQLWTVVTTIAGAVAGIVATGRLEGSLAGGIAGIVTFFILEWRGSKASAKPS